MPKLSVYNMAGKATGEEIELNEEVFGVEFNEPVVHQAIVMQQANQRQGTSATKTRGMVRGGGRKPWRQKGGCFICRSYLYITWPAKLPAKKSN